MKVYYILLKEQLATKKEKTLLTGSRTEATHVLEGSLWFYEALKEASLQNLNCTGSGKFKQSDLTLLSLDFDNTKLHCSYADAGRLKEEEYLLLFALSSFEQRVNIFRDEKWWSEAIKIQMNSYVWVLGKGARNENRMLGRVRYRGPLPSFKGIWFGVELSTDHHRQGSTDGLFRNKRYFECPEDTGLYVHLGRLRLCEDGEIFAKKFPPLDPQEWRYSTPVQHQDGESPSHIQKLLQARTRRDNIVRSDELTQPDLQVGERVVWLSDSGPEAGVVKWIGFLPDAKTKEWTVGVEFDKPIGTGTGKYENHQLFRARHKHASLVPILGLIKEEQMYGMSLPVSEYNHTKSRCTPTGRKERSCIGDDIVQSQDLLLKQYEEEYTRCTSGAKASKVVSPTDVRLNLNSTRGPPTAGKQARVVNEKSIYDAHPVYENMATDGDEQFQRPSQIAAGNSMEEIYGDVHFPGRPGHEEKRESMEHAYEVFDYQENNNRFPPKVRSPTDPFLPKPRAKPKSKSASEDYYQNYGGYLQDQQYGQITSHGHRRGMPVGPPPMGRVESDCVSPGPAPRRHVTEPIMSTRPKQQTVEAEATRRVKTEPIPIKPHALNPSELNTEFELGCLVEVLENPPECRYGVIRWIGYIKDKSKPLVGLEMEEESPACTDGTFGKDKLFDCPPKKAYFTYLSKIKKDGRFDESLRFFERQESQAFGSTDCPDIAGIVSPPSVEQENELEKFTGKGRGIQGHHNSCYMDATLFSMFAFSSVFDTILHRERSLTDIARYEEVQKVLRDGIVNPLRSEFFVRADKMLKLRSLLDELSDVKGLMTEEKDPEEFFNCLLQQIMKADPFIKLSSDQMSHYYQLFVEKDERIMLPTTQQLLDLSFLQSDVKLTEVPSCLILQMPRFGKDFKVYNRIVPSPYLDITDILESGPRECTICGHMASHECKDCYRHFGSSLDKIAFCENCLRKSHSHSKRASHKPRSIPVNKDYQEHVEALRQQGNSEPCVEREVLELFAVICIETSHYVSFVKCGTGESAPWLFFDSMADRMGAQNGYNVPEVRLCDDLPEWLLDSSQGRIMACREDRDLPEQMKRLLCDSYICLYQSPLLVGYK